MPGVEPARTGADDTHVSILSYVLQGQQAQHDLFESELEALRAALVVEHADIDRRSAERNAAGRESAQMRTENLERWVKDVMDQHWSTHHREHEAYRVASSDKLTAWQTAHDNVHALIQVAVDKAQASLDERLKGMNEFRAQLDRMIATLVTNSVLDVRMAAISEQEQLIRDEHDKQRDVLMARVNVLENHRANQEGRFAMLGAALSALVIVVELVFHFYKA